MTKVSGKSLNWLILTAVTSVGCTASPAPNLGPHPLTCHGSDWTPCHRKAKKLCGTPGYTVVSQVSDAGNTAGGRDQSLVNASATHRTLLVECNPSANKG